MILRKYNLSSSISPCLNWSLKNSGLIFSFFRDLRNPSFLEYFLFISQISGFFSSNFLISENPNLLFNPFCKFTYIIKNFFLFKSHVMRAVFVNTKTFIIGFVIAITSYMVSSFHNNRNPFCKFS